MKRMGFALALMACGGGSSEPVVPVLDRLEPRVTPASVRVGQTAQASATAYDRSGQVMPTPRVTWVSSNSAVVTVDSTGLVRGVAVGTATVVGSAGTVLGSAVVTVTAP